MTYKPGTYNMLPVKRLLTLLLTTAATTQAALYVSPSCKAQVIPSDNDTIFQTQVMFSVPPVVNAVSYRFVIQEPELITREEEAPATLINNLKFGQVYRWKVEVKTRDSVITSGLYTFITAEQTFSDPSIERFRIIKNNNHPEKYEDGLVMLDYGNVAINRNGEVIWFQKPGYNNPGGRRICRPVQLTSQGTILFTTDNAAFECTLHGEMLWQAPPKISQFPDSPLVYHHDIQEFSKDNYLTLVKYREKMLLPEVGPDSVDVDNDAVIIFNKKENTRWVWKLGDRITHHEKGVYFSRKRLGGEKLLPVGEINSVYMDEKKQNLYIGIKDMNCVLVVAYPSGRILRSYGDSAVASPRNYASGFFKYQHGCIPNKKNNLVVFNNNGEFGRDPSRVVIFSEPERSRDSAVKIWEFDCFIDSLTPSKTSRLGYALPLSNGNILVCMGNAARLFEITPQKNIVWDCIPETRPAITAAWDLFPNYRAYYYPNLYPNFFTVQPRTEGSLVKLNIFNKGFTDDLYRIYQKDNKGQRKLVTVQPVMAFANKCAKINVNAGRHGYFEVESMNTGEVMLIRY